MLTQKRHILTVAAVIATLTMAGGVGAVALEAHRAPAPTAQPTRSVASATTPATRTSTTWGEAISDDAAHLGWDRRDVGGDRDLRRARLLAARPGSASGGVVLARSASGKLVPVAPSAGVTHATTGSSSVATGGGSGQAVTYVKTASGTVPVPSTATTAAAVTRSS